ncbi:phosphatidylinositol 4-phosphate 3-kinase C2 domain-containing subunit beta-like isoform X2 [Branchiostoma floridae x Branchiostoma belcheri]
MTTISEDELRAALREEAAALEQFQRQRQTTWPGPSSQQSQVPSATQRRDTAPSGTQRSTVGQQDGGSVGSRALKSSTARPTPAPREHVPRPLPRPSSMGTIQTSGSTSTSAASSSAVSEGDLISFSSNSLQDVLKSARLSAPPMVTGATTLGSRPLTSGGIQSQRPATFSVGDFQSNGILSSTGSASLNPFGATNSTNPFSAGSSAWNGRPLSFDTNTAAPMPQLPPHSPVVPHNSALFVSNPSFGDTTLWGQADASSLNFSAQMSVGAVSSSRPQSLSSSSSGERTSMAANFASLTDELLFTDYRNPAISVTKTAPGPAGAAAAAAVTDPSSGLSAFDLDFLEKLTMKESVAPGVNLLDKDKGPGGKLAESGRTGSMGELSKPGVLNSNLLAVSTTGLSHSTGELYNVSSADTTAVKPPPLPPKTSKRRTMAAPSDGSMTVPTRKPQQTYVRRDSADGCMTVPARKSPVASTKEEKRPATTYHSAAAQTQANRVFFGDGLFDLAQERDEEASIFAQVVSKLRMEYKYDHATTNPGHLVSPILRYQHCREESTLKVVIHTLQKNSEPVTFTCDVETSVSHLVSQAVVSLLDDDTDVSVDDFALKVCGREEFLANDTTLGDYEYVQDCEKFDLDVALVLYPRDVIPHQLARTAEDDAKDTKTSNLNHFIDNPVRTAVSKRGLGVLVDAFYNEADKLRSHASLDWDSCKSNGVVQAIKALCATLASLETVEVSQAVGRLKRAVPAPRQPSVAGPEGLSEMSRASVVNNIASLSKEQKQEEVNLALEEVTAAILALVDMYSSAFDTDFTTNPQGTPTAGIVDVTGVSSNVRVRLVSAHRLPINSNQLFEKFRVSSGVFHGGHKMCDTKQTNIRRMENSFFPRLVWDEWVEFSLPLCLLPREARLCVALYGVNSGADSNRPYGVTVLGWAAIPLFNYRGHMLHGPHLLGLWPESKVNPIGTCSSNLLQPDSIILQVEFPSHGGDVIFPPPEPHYEGRQYSFSVLDDSTREQIQEIVAKASISKLSEEEEEMLWEKRHYCHTVPAALPRVLKHAPSWDWASLADIYSLVHNWSPLTPVSALELLHPHFADKEVRATAISWMQHLPDDELYDFLPQLVQALRYECYHDSALARFLLERSLASVRIAQQLYWHLKDNVGDQQFGQRFQMVLAGLLSTCGRALRTEFEKQVQLIRQLHDVAVKVKSAKDSARQAMLQHAMEKINNKMVVPFRLPTNPALVCSGINFQSCSYFTSNATPLRLVFGNADSLGEEIQAMYKVGDDLRQDMLTLQMIRIMNKLWLREGLDLRMITFACVATGKEAGMVEIIPKSETLRKIQTEQGVTGSFKDKPLADWLQKHNATEAEYEKAVENFMFSCAGYCVATYVLGIGDRHNDNIMIKTTGHMFHIDFGKFLGNAQMFGKIKRDRAPFVLTSDMAYVINDGDRPSTRFQDFVDLCCEAFNIIRKNANLFINLFGLMLSSGIPALSRTEDIQYVHNALKPSASDAEATAHFTRLIEVSLGSRATQINFFMHNLAQMRFSGNAGDESLFTFSPKVYSMEKDGKIISLSVFGFQKRYSGEKYYVYIIKVYRQDREEPTFVFRTYDELFELHQRLTLAFPHNRLPSFPTRTVIGRSNIKQVAERRQVDLNIYLQEVMSAPPQVSQSDLVYTFFHPMLRDEKDAGAANMLKIGDSSQRPPTIGQVGGSVKLSIHYKKNGLFIMVMHAKDLMSQDGEYPNPYVKTYLLPDPAKQTKQKTKIAKKSLNPTYNEMLVYNVPLADVQRRTLQLTVWSSESVRENCFLGGTNIRLKELDLKQETVQWYQLGNMPHR